MMNLEKICECLGSHQSELILPDNAKFTSVLIPLIEKDGQLHVLFEVRSNNIAQAGEISFPGGHVEKGETAKETAIRETCEELLIRPEQVEIICPLHRLADRVRIVVDSYLGILHDYEGTFDPKEVARVFTVPLNDLLNEEPQISYGEMILQRGDDFPYELIPGGEKYRFYPVPRRFIFYKEDNEIIWGLTGELLDQFLKLLRKELNQ